MEDAATAEISRAQLWQWVHHVSKLRRRKNRRHPARREHHHRWDWQSRRPPSTPSATPPTSRPPRLVPNWSAPALRRVPHPPRLPAHHQRGKPHQGLAGVETSRSGCFERIYSRLISTKAQIAYGMIAIHDIVLAGTGDEIEGDDPVEFRLIYEGTLPPSGGRRHQTCRETPQIRRFLHPQLRRLWHVQDNLRHLAEHACPPFDAQLKIVEPLGTETHKKKESDAGASRIRP